MKNYTNFQKLKLHNWELDQIFLFNSKRENWIRTICIPAPMSQEEFQHQQQQVTLLLPIHIHYHQPHQQWMLSYLQTAVPLLDTAVLHFLVENYQFIDQGTNVRNTIHFITNFCFSYIQETIHTSIFQQVVKYSMLSSWFKATILLVVWNKNSKGTTCVHLYLHHHYRYHRGWRQEPYQKASEIYLWLVSTSFSSYCLYGLNPLDYLGTFKYPR